MVYGIINVRFHKKKRGVIMRSYYCENRGLLSFLAKTEEVKKVIANNFSTECGCDFFASTPLCYLRLIDYVREKAQGVFKREGAALFQIQLLASERVLYIRIKNSAKEIITILTIYFSVYAAEAQTHCEKSLGWSADAFRYIFKEVVQRRPVSGRLFFLSLIRQYLRVERLTG